MGTIYLFDQKYRNNSNIVNLIAISNIGFLF